MISLTDCLQRALAEREAMGRKKVPVSDASSGGSPSKENVPDLPQGKLNAVRAAFKAGIKPSQIARQFGIPQSDVRKALASEEAER